MFLCDDVLDWGGTALWAILACLAAAFAGLFPLFMIRAESWFRPVYVAPIQTVIYRGQAYVPDFDNCDGVWTEDDEWAARVRAAYAEGYARQKAELEAAKQREPCERAAGAGAMLLAAGAVLWAARAERRRQAFESGVTPECEPEPEAARDDAPPEPCGEAAGAPCWSWSAASSW